VLQLPRNGAHGCQLSKRTEIWSAPQDRELKKLDAPLLCAAAALGVENNETAEDLIATEVCIETPEGPIRAKALIDCGAQSNFMDQLWAKQYLDDAKDTGPRKVKALDGHQIQSYGARKLMLSTTDDNQLTRQTMHVFEAVSIEGYDIILGLPWLRATNPIMDWQARTWTYREATKVEIMHPSRAVKKILKGNAAFIITKATKDDDNRPSFYLRATLAKPEELPAYLREYADVFSEKEANILPEHANHDHGIDLEPGMDPPHRPIYNLSEKELGVLRNYIEEALAKGWIRPSKSPAGAPILFVPKKDGTLRLCVDYRGLNAITIKNRHPLPLISETMDRLAGAKIFTQLDLRDAYHRVRIRKGDEWKTAWRSRYGHFEYQVMPFGLANAPATFQAYINKALSDLLDICCVVYLDDILIYSASVEEHHHHVQMVMERLRQYKLYAKLSKCAFDTDTVRFLGFEINTKGIHMESERIQTINEWPLPASVKDVQTFLGFANFYRRFIRDFARICAPLNVLTKGQPKKKARKGSAVHREQGMAKFELTEKAKQAFQELQRTFTSAPFLKHFDPKLPIRVETDASAFAIGAIILQLQPDDQQWHPVAYWSRKLAPAEVNYETHDAELLAIVAAFKQWRHYLEGSRMPVTVLSDHANLRYFMTTKELTRRQTRWAEQLSAFDFTIEHRPGSKNPADAPSRRPDYAEEVTARTLLPTLREKLQRGIFGAQEVELQNSPDYKEIIVGLLAHTRGRKRTSHVDESSTRGDESIPADEGSTDGVTGLLETLVPRAIVRNAMRLEKPYEQMPEPMAQLLLKVQQRDAFATERTRELRSEEKGAAKDPAWSISENGLLRYERKAYVPNDAAIRAEIMRVNHDDPAGGHFGEKRTADIVGQKYYWQGMRRDIRAYVKSCDLCQRVAIHRHKEYGQLEPLPTPPGPFETITLDFITGLPPARYRGQAYDAILVVVDAYTKWAMYIPCTKRMDAPELAETLVESVFSKYGMPKKLVSDRGSLFTSAFWTSLCYYLGAQRRLSTAFHPQTDGQTERQNQTLEHYLRCYINYRQDDWPQWLPLAQFTYNQAKHRSTGISPAEALMGYLPTLRINVDNEPPEKSAPAAKERAEQLIEVRTLLETNLQEAQESQKKYHDRKHKPMKFEVGDKVWLKAKNIRTMRPSKKLDHRQLGPFRIIAAWGKQAYKLELTPLYRNIHPVFHVSLLEIHTKREGDNPEPPPTLVDEEEEWLVERILDSRKNGTEFLVKWKGYSPADNTWEPLEHVKDTVALGEFLADEANPPEVRHKRGRPRKYPRRDTRS